MEKILSLIDTLNTSEETKNMIISEFKSLRSEIDDLQILYENTVEHGTTIEDELKNKHEEVNRLLGSMKKYLSPQLYDSIVGGQTNVELYYKRKKLTIFFSDIVGFTSTTDMLEAEVLSELLNQYLDEMSKIALTHGGTIDKFIGDAVMIFHGDPQFIDDKTHARDCVLMAIEMQEKIHELSDNWVQKGAQHGLMVRMGINTGYCTVGNFGSENRMDYTIVGGQVNIASRLEHQADYGTILISGTTHSLVEDIIDVEFKGALEVKGVHFPIQTYKVLGLKGEAGRKPKLLKLGNNELSLNPIKFKYDSAREAERQEIIEALQEALSFLSELK